MNLSNKLKSSGVKQSKQRTEPIWKGPCSVDKQGGITFSLLSRFLVCRERFRLLAVEGLKPTDEFNQRLEYGNMWHGCEEAFAQSGNPIVNNPVASPPWMKALITYCQGLAKRYPTQGQQVEHWYNICKTQFPIYIDWWKKHPDVKERTPLLQEQTFSVPYKLPSGRVVILRGKWDSVDLIGKGKNAGVYLRENKSKGDIDADQMRRQLMFDLQTMLYLVALSEERHRLDDSTIKNRLSYHDGKFRNFYPLRGVRYNVIRRPLSGGKGSIRQKKGQTEQEFYAELAELMKDAIGPEWGMQPGDHFFFMRWKVEISASDIEKFKRECLNPVLEQLCDWWEDISARPDNPFDYGEHAHHFRLPYGIYNPMLEGRASEVDEFLASGSETGLQRTETLFSELE